MKVPLLWRLAPTTLFRFPRTAAAVAFSAGVVVLATILGPLFLESSETASLRAGIEGSGRWSTGLQIRWRQFGSATSDEEAAQLRRIGVAGRDELAELVAGAPGVGPPVTTYLGGQSLATSETGRVAARLISRDGAFENVDVIERDGAGVWLADVSAASLGVRPGDTISIETSGRTRRARVGAIYDYLGDEAVRDYWAPLTDFIHIVPGEDIVPPPFVIADPGFVTSTDWGTQVRWNIPLESVSLSPAMVRDAAREFRRVTRAAIAGTSEFGRAVQRAGGFGFDPEIDSLLPGIMDTAQDRLDASQAPAGVVTAAARLLGAGLMVAAGLSLVARRRSEVRALIGRGASPGSLALRFAVEGTGPAVLGAVAGILAGYAGVLALGAAGAVEWSYVTGLADDAALAALGALVLLATATGAAVLREERSFATRTSAARRLLPLVAGAAVAAGGVLAFRSLQSVTVESSDEPLRGSVLLAPIGLIAAAALVAGVALRLTLPLVATWARRRSTGTFLAAKRLAAGSGMTHALVIVCGSALGVMFFGLTVAGSVQRTATAKAKTFVGSDFAVGIAPNPPPLQGLDFPAAHVTKIETYLQGTPRPVTVLGIDPKTFEAAAFWDDEFASESLEDLISGLSDATEGPIPVVAAGFPDGVTPELAGSEIALDVTGRAAAFPGMTPHQPLVAMTTESAIRAIQGGVDGTRVNMIWAKGEADEIERALIDADQAVFDPVTSEEVLDSPTLQSLLWSLGLLGGVGALASVTAVAGLSLYLQAKHTSAQVAAAMTRRMGMRRRAELLSWAAEIGGAGLASFAVGAATGVGTALVVHERLDIQPDLNPHPIFVVPTLVVTVTGIAVAVLATTTARRLQKRMDRAPVGEIMRV